MFELFSSAEARTFRPPPLLHPACDRCRLYETCNSPKMPVDGEGRRKVFLVAEYPGADEDRTGRPLTGGTGRFLEDECRAIGVNMRRDAWLGNALICHNNTGREVPTAVTDCRPNLLRSVRQLKPNVIVLMGGLALRSLIGHLWKEDVGVIPRWTGWQIPARPPVNAWVVVLNNPAYVMRSEGPDTVLRDEFRAQLAAAFALDAPPWPTPPRDPAADVEIITDPTAAAARLSRYTSGRIAFDFETDRSKADHADARIVCCSVCWEDRETIAYPWHGPARDATKALLENPDVSKVGSNIAFEDKWCRRFGITVQGWEHDTMLVAHMLDPRAKDDTDKKTAGVSGIKFQAFVRLGVPDYNHHVEPFLRPKGEDSGNAQNQIASVKLDLLLRYCGLDSLLEYRVAMLQRKDLGYGD